MSNDLIRYDLLVQEALCGVVKKVLADVARHGLPGDHHFYITFRTKAQGVRLSSRMRADYPEEMTIILQHQFDDLKVTDFAFEVGLHFKGVPEILLVPFQALTGFFDPSVHFSAKFEPQGEGEIAASTETIAPGEPMKGLPAPAQLASVPKSVKPTTIKPKPRLETVSDAPSDANGDAPAEEAKVVSIDAFRKKP